LYKDDMLLYFYDLVIFFAGIPYCTVMGSRDTKSKVTEPGLGVHILANPNVDREALLSDQTVAEFLDCIFTQSLKTFQRKKCPERTLVALYPPGTLLNIK
jgi:hypothetical protein